MSRVRAYSFDELTSDQQAGAWSFETKEVLADLIDSYTMGRVAPDLGDHAAAVRSLFEAHGPYNGSFIQAALELAAATPELRATLDAIVTKRVSAVLYVPDGVEVCWLEEVDGKPVFRYPRYED